MADNNSSNEVANLVLEKVGDNSCLDYIAGLILAKIQSGCLGVEESEYFTEGPRYNLVSEYLNPVVYFALERFCLNDEFKEKFYRNIPEGVIRDIFTIRWTPPPYGSKKYKKLDEVGSEYYPLVRMLTDHCNKKSNHVKKWLKQHQKNSIKSANKQ